MAKRQVKPRVSEPAVSGEAAAPAVRRFTGPFSISHAGIVYTRNAAGVIELPADEKWYLPLVEAGMLTEV